MLTFQAAGFQPVRPEISTNGIDNNLEPVDPKDMEDEDNADELGESGGEAHMTDHYQFRSWCRYCMIAASRSDHHRRQAKDSNEVPVISCDYGFFTDGRDDEERGNSSGRYTHTRDSGQEKQNDSCRLCAAKDLKTNFQLRQKPSGFWDWVILK